MSARQRVTLGEVTENFDSRRVPVRTPDRKAGRYPYYGASGIIDYVDSFIFEGEYLLIAEDGENLRSRSTSIAFLASGQFWVNNHAHVVQANKHANTRFLSYLLSITDVNGYLTGSTQPKLSRGSMDSIKLELPPLSEQEAIAEVLGALDDKIAANSKLAERAEDLAKTLLVPFQPTVPLGEVVQHRKRSVNPSLLTSPSVAHFSLPAFDNGKMPEMVNPSEIKSSKFLFEQPSVLISKLNPRFPRVWDVAEVPPAPALASTEFLVLEPLRSTTSFLWACLSQPRFGESLEAKVAGTSGSHQRVKPVDLLNAAVVNPDKVSRELQSQVTGAGLVAQHAREENLTLATTRDALLPQLMSGKLRVKDIADGVESLV